ncbi:hypothetical protein VNO77_24122 [Canavalia gladiata]|uniref:Uncharacterized protein n=1 Tax=Canavalia gladiata TaxID=3824 RepID=A0AAN9L5N6_CANGL
MGCVYIYREDNTTLIHMDCLFSLFCDSDFLHNFRSFADSKFAPAPSYSLFFWEYVDSLRMGAVVTTVPCGLYFEWNRFS